MKIALTGQPNCGKSTVFNSVAGYKSVVGNYPGKTVGTVRSQVALEGVQFDLVDMPGIYSLTCATGEEVVARDVLLGEKADVIAHVVDASVLCRSLELVTELLELETPLVLGLNMMDEAARKGVDVDVGALSAALGIPVVPMVASRGEGIPEFFRAAIAAASAPRKPDPTIRSDSVEKAAAALMECAPDLEGSLGVPARFAALNLLEGDEEFESRIRRADPAMFERVKKLRKTLEESCGGRPADVIMSAERHALSVGLFEKTAKVRSGVRASIRDRFDDYATHPVLGYVILGSVLVALFYSVFGLGKFIEEPLLAAFESFEAWMESRLAQDTFAYVLLSGLIQGFSGGVAIVLPYLVPFLLGLALLEDVGYVPRAAFLMDAFMHRIGLHGKAVIPFVLGYGCTVPAIMGARILESRRDRVITSVLVNFIPCSARTVVIFALVGAFLGPLTALLLYLLNVLVVAGVGRLMMWLNPEASPGMILELPGYKVPTPKAVVKKVWFRLREFIVIAWPILIAGSVALSLMKHFGMGSVVDDMLSPFTSGVLGLPRETGVPLVFGILRKELTVVMLIQALGTSEFSSVLSDGQMVSFTVFSIFYVPCLATLAVMRAVIGMKHTLLAALLSTVVATMAALAFRLAFAVF